MKQWQQVHLHRVLDIAEWMNQNSWWAVIIGGIQIIVGAILENNAVTWAGGAIVTVGTLMTFAVTIVISYIKWRKKMWK
jgi:ABC-type Mn2+/Zn2+ transport system permease subunit